ncbi:unnamed protein product [Cylindrotheca closterium]|uniref:Uncharacterized protein n=1 Tax=Cylindrotheca closterium TaxID=2856 RepID=A0AAD2FND7_9STRA|nr:unnamed protein product [Cylindrotheca closterium]
MSSPSAEYHKELRIETNDDDHRDSELTDSDRRDRSMLKKAPVSTNKSSNPPISPLQSFMGNLMSTKRVTRIVEDNARISSVKQNFTVSTNEARRGSERWASASTFSSDTTTRIPMSAIGSPLPSSSASRFTVPMPNAESQFFSPPTRPASTVDASAFSSSLKVSPRQEEDTSPSNRTSERRGGRTRSPNHSSAPRKPKRRNSSDLSLSPIR